MKQKFPSHKARQEYEGGIDVWVDKRSDDRQHTPNRKDAVF